MADGDSISQTRRLRPATPVPGRRPAGDTAPAATDDSPTDGPGPDATAVGSTPEPAAAPDNVPSTRAKPTAAVRRIPPPRQAATSAVRAVRRWSRRPGGRITLPALLLLAIVATTGAAGAVLVPATAHGPRPAAQIGGTVPVDPASAGTAQRTDAAQPTATAQPTVTPPGGPSQPAGTPTAAGVNPPVDRAGGGRPADALAGWAAQTGAKVGVPAVAMQAYGYAELVVRQTTPACGLSWTTLAAIGEVESTHGAVNGTTLLPDGKVQPKIIGLPLDGQGGRQRVTDTDAGQLDGDIRYDRALGPMQFIPATWRDVGVDADNDGQKDPQDIDDAALAAATYLCRGGRNLTIPQDWWSAVLSYNELQPYARSVYEAANQYGSASRT